MKQQTLFKLLFIICFVFFIGCSTDDSSNSSSENNLILIKKITEIVYYNQRSDTISANFIYENNVLKKIIQDDKTAEFIYNSNKIDKLSYLSSDGSPSYTSFYYVDDLLSYTLSGVNQDEKTKYTYQNNILSKIESGYLEGTTFIVQQSKDLTYNSSKNVAQQIKTSSFFGSEQISKEIYSYDTKNNPMRDMNKYYKLILSLEGFNGFSINNVINRESYFPITNIAPGIYNYQIIYNNDNFPTEIKKISAFNNTLISKTIIQYQ